MKSARLTLLALTVTALPARAAAPYAQLRPTQTAPKTTVASIPVVIKQPLLPTAAPPSAATSLDVLARLPASAVSPDRLAAEIASSDSVEDAMGRLTQLGLLGADEIPARSGDRLFLLSRLWDGTSSKLLAERFPIDRSWSVPAVRVQTPETTYLIHPVNHGSYFASNRGNVLKLVEQIKRSGQSLYSEQGAWAHFGFVSGKEFNDKDAAAGKAPAAALEHGPAHVQQAQAKASRRFELLFLYTAAPALAMSALSDLAGPYGIALVGLVSAGILWLLLSGRRALSALADLSEAREAARAGRSDKAEQLRREAFALHGRQPDPLEVLRLALPPALAQPYDTLAARNQAMAHAARVNAMATGDKIVHLLVGFSHAAAVAWYLASPKDPGEGPTHGSQLS